MGDIAPPEGWVDRSMVIHSAQPSPGRVVPNIVIARENCEEDESFADFCLRQSELFRIKLPDFIVHTDLGGRIGNYPTNRIDFAWNSEAGAIRQQLSFINVGNGAVVVFTASAAAAEFDDQRAIFDAQLSALAASDTLTSRTANGTAGE